MEKIFFYFGAVISVALFFAWVVLRDPKEREEKPKVDGRFKTLSEEERKNWHP